MTAASTADRIVEGKIRPTVMAMKQGTLDMREHLAKRELPVIVADNVADYVAKHYEKGGRYEIGGFPCLAPPWEWAWIEYANQGTERRGAYLIGFDLKKASENERSELTGLIGGAIADAKKQSPGQEPRWALGFFMFVDDTREVVGPIGSIVFILDDHGKELGNRWFTSPEVSWREADDPDAQRLFRMVLPALQTISFMHCKNVIVDHQSRPPKLAKAYRRRHGEEPIKWQTVRLELPRQASDPGEARGPGVAPSLHIVSGHFSHYGDCCPTTHEPKGKLFGRLEGVYWMPQHMRGDPVHEVKSDRVAVIRGGSMSTSGASDEPECGHYFHASTSHGFCPQCGGQWKRRHRRTGGSMSTSGDRRPTTREDQP